jgi:hypothetical protein
MAASESRADQTASYAELASKTYSTLIDAASEVNHRALGYGKALFDIMTRPYKSNTAEDAARENFDRASQLVDVTVKELQNSGAHAAKLGQQISHLNAEWQEIYTQTVKGLTQTGASNFNWFKETTEKQFNGFTQRVQDIASTTPVVSGVVKKN